MCDISIIIPVYNVENFIKDCLDSIHNQTYKNYECIIVDDGSNDKSLEICEKYKKKDSRFKVFHQSNSGVSAARNKGLEISKGKYITFVDSDDIVSSTYLENLMLKPEIDLMITGIRDFTDNVNRAISRQKFNNEFFGEIDNSILGSMIKNKSFDYVCGKRFKRDIINQNKILFNKQLNLGEDTLFVANYLLYTKSIYYISDQDYYYRVNRENTMSSFNANFVEKLENANKLILDVIKNRFPEFEENINWKKRIFSIYYYSIFLVLKTKKYSFFKKYFFLRKIIKNSDFHYYKNDVDIYMKNDSQFLRYIIKSGNPFFILIIFSLLQLINKH